MRYLKSLTFKICILITLIEIIFFVILGTFYSVKYVNQLHAGLENDIVIPGTLISKGLLDFESITDPAIMEDIIGVKPLEAYIVGLNMNIFFSLDSDQIGLSIDEIKGVDREMFNISSPQIIIKDRIIDGISSKICITPVYSYDKESATLFTYIRIATETVEKERNSIIYSFIIGFLICIIFTNLTIIIIFKIYIYNRVDDSIVVMERVEQGDLSARIKKHIKSDEISALQLGINSMINKLQIQVYDLSNEIIEREKQESEKESIQRALTQSAKLAELGALSAGIAHEFRNPISGIFMTIQNINSRLFNTTLQNNIESAERNGIPLHNLEVYLKDRKIDGMITTIEDLASNMNQIVGNMLSYSRKTMVAFSPLNIENIVEESLLLAKFNPAFRQIQDVKLSVDGVIPNIECHKNEVIQVLLNIISNGSEALVHYKKEIPEFKAELNISISRNSNYITIKIHDNGPGLDEDVKKTLFEPFYTTKDEGKGTGLGLYLCKIIVEEKHHGQLIINNDTEKGTTFSIVLPIEQ